MEHTKGELKQGHVTPWELWIGADRHIADVHGHQFIRQANAARLVKCWNCHDELLDACNKISTIKQWAMRIKDVPAEVYEDIEQIEQVIAKAEQEREVENELEITI